MSWIRRPIADGGLSGIDADLDSGSATITSILRGATGRFGVVSFGSSSCLPSLSGLRTNDSVFEPGSPDVQARLRSLGELMSADHESAPGEHVRRFLATEVGAEPLVLIDSPRRPGEIGLMVASSDAVDDVTRERLTYAVSSSRMTLFFLENGIDAFLRRASAYSHESPSATSARTLAELDTALHEDRVRTLIGTASQALEIGYLRVYEARDGRAYGATDWLPSDGTLPVGDAIELVDRIDIPPPPSSGAELVEFEKLVQASWRRRRRLSGLVAGSDVPFFAITVPYGLDIRSDRPAGVLCHLVPLHDAPAVERYEIVFSAHLATWLARVAAERRLGGTVARLAQELEALGTGRSNRSELLAGSDPFERCDVGLRSRRDIALLIENMPSLFAELRSLCSAKSCTFRLLSGDAGIDSVGNGDDRWLRRVYSDGDEEWSLAPWHIALSGWRSSVNAWVARHGTAVYLRDIPPGYGPICEDECPDIARYPGLDCVSIFRSDIRAELCVPVFAESRLVGTLNIESTRVGAFDEVALSVEEFAQVIGLALLEARRRIAVDIMETAGGFLDRRHELDSRLGRLQKSIRTAEDLREDLKLTFIDEIDAVREFVFVKPHDDGESTEMTLEQVLRGGMEKADSAYSAMSIADFGSALLVEDVSVLNTVIAPELVHPCVYALSQMFANMKTHRTAVVSPRQRERLGFGELPFRFEISEIVVGGRRNLLVALVSPILRTHAEKIDVSRLFREPMLKGIGERVGLGAYLSGEIVRRAGGAVSARLDRTTLHPAQLLRIEISIPV